MSSLTPFFRSGGRSGSLLLCHSDLEAFRAAIQILVDTDEDPCQRGAQLIDANFILRIAVPLMKTPADEISLEKLVPLIDVLQHYSFIDASSDLVIAMT